MNNLECPYQGENCTITCLYLVRKVDTHQCIFCHQNCLSCTLGGNSIISLHLFYWNIPAHILHCLLSIRLYLSKVKEQNVLLRDPAQSAWLIIMVIILKKYQGFSLCAHREQRTECWFVFPFVVTSTTSRSSPVRSTTARVRPGASSTMAAVINANCWQNKRIRGMTQIRLNDYVF